MDMDLAISLSILSGIFAYLTFRYYKCWRDIDKY